NVPFPRKRGAGILVDGAAHATGTPAFAKDGSKVPVRRGGRNSRLAAGVAPTAAFAGPYADIARPHGARFAWTPNRRNWSCGSGFSRELFASCGLPGARSGLTAMSS